MQSTGYNYRIECKRGRTSLEDDPRSGCPKIAASEIINKVARYCIRLKVSEIANAVGISDEQTFHNLPEESVRSHPEINTLALCKIGQRIVQDITTYTCDIFQNMRTMQPPNGTVRLTAINTEKKKQLRLRLQSLQRMFKHVRDIFKQCEEKCKDIQDVRPEMLIQLKEDCHTESDGNQTSASLQVDNSELEEMYQQLFLKNEQLKEVIDVLRKTIWDINIMLAVRSH